MEIKHNYRSCIIFFYGPNILETPSYRLHLFFPVLSMLWIHNLIFFVLESAMWKELANSGYKNNNEESVVCLSWLLFVSLLLVFKWWWFYIFALFRSSLSHWRIDFSSTYFWFNTCSYWFKRWFCSYCEHSNWKGYFYDLFRWASFV